MLSDFRRLFAAPADLSGCADWAGGSRRVYHTFMTRAASVPAESDLLCEGCGYVLNGLPEDGRCPECGKPLQESTPALRYAPAWERAESASGGRLKRFSRTTADCILRPT